MYYIVTNNLIEGLQRSAVHRRGGKGSRVRAANTKQGNAQARHEMGAVCPIRRDNRRDHTCTRESRRATWRACKMRIRLRLTPVRYFHTAPKIISHKDTTHCTGSQSTASERLNTTTPHPNLLIIPQMDLYNIANGRNALRMRQSTPERTSSCQQRAARELCSLYSVPYRTVRERKVDFRHLFACAVFSGLTQLFTDSLKFCRLSQQEDRPSALLYTRALHSSKEI